MIHRKIKLAIVLLLVFQMVIPAPIFAAAVGQFASVVGNVTQTRASVIIKPEVKSPIELKDLIVTGDKAAASMVFADESSISLAANSKFEIKEFYVKDTTRKGLFSLALGKLTADVRKFIGGNNTFEVQTPTAIAGVRGTGFEIAIAMVGSQMTTTVTCTAGAMSVSAVSVTGAIVTTTSIVAGQTAVVTSAGITVSATAAGAAGMAGATAGATTTAGVTAGTVATAVAVAAAVVAVIAATVGSETTTVHHATTNHHGTTETHSH